MLARIYLWTNDAKLRKTSFSSTVQNVGETVCAWTWCLQKLHTTAYVQLQYTYKLTYMEFTTLIIMVGHVDPDIPLTNVQVSVTHGGIRYGALSSQRSHSNAYACGVPKRFLALSDFRCIEKWVIPHRANLRRGYRICSNKRPSWHSNASVTLQHETFDRYWIITYEYARYITIRTIQHEPLDGYLNLPHSLWCR